MQAQIGGLARRRPGHWNWSFGRHSCSEAGCNLRDALILPNPGDSEALQALMAQVMDAADDSYSFLGGER